MKLKKAVSDIINHAVDRVLIVGLGPVGGRAALAFERLGAQKEAPPERGAVVV